MFGHRGGTGKGVTSTFPVKFHTLWTRKLLKSDQIISLTVINKTTVWGKMCVPLRQNIAYLRKDII